MGTDYFAMESLGGPLLRGRSVISGCPQKWFPWTVHSVTGLLALHTTAKCAVTPCNNKEVNLAAHVQMVSSHLLLWELKALNHHVAC